MPDSFTARPAATTGIMFRVLGPLQVEGPAGTVRIPPGRQEIILACLLMEAGRVVATDRLLDLIWHEEPPDTARTQIQICVSRIRKSFTAAGLSASVVSRAPGYLLRTDEDTVDLHVFNRQVTAARVLVKEGRLAEAAESLRAAVALWRGPCLSGIPSEALRTRGLRLDEDRLTAIETYLELELGLGRSHEIVGEASRLVHEYPLRERLRGQLMLALYRSGRQAEALDVYRAGRELLAEELGLAPGEELRQLEGAILAGDPAALHATGAPAPEPVRPPVASVHPTPYGEERPHQLPADTADFVTSEPLVRSLERALLGDDGQRALGVVVIAGKPGIGKSALGTHLAHRLGGERFPDGQLYCDLRGAGTEPVSTKDALGRFLRALGIPGPVIPDDTDERAEMYRTLLATRRMLVVLDDAASERQISPLLPGSSSCAVLVTSRSRLTALPGAHRVELDVLDQTQALDLLGRVIGTERVEREPEAAAALVRTVGGLPLALRIVAARLAARPHWTLASMVHRLANERHRLDELAHGEMTMRASLSLTHDGLNRADRRLLRLFSLAQGPTVPGWIAGALLDDHRPIPSDLVEPLVDVQMLDAVAVESTGEFRYRFHEVIRLFAREQLALNDSPAVQLAATERMIGGWLAITEQAHARVYGGDFTVLRGTAARWSPPTDYVDGLLTDPIEWLDSEQANLCLAVDQAAQAGLDELCWDLATTLVTLFEARGYFDHWERTHQRALQVTRAADNRRGTAAVLSSLGTLHISRQQPDQARRSLSAAQETFDELGDLHGLALCRRDLALLERQGGDDDRALVLYEHAARDFERVGDIVGRATVLTQSAHIWMRRGHSAVAQAQLEESLEIFRSVGYSRGEAHALRRAGQVLLQRGEHAQAEQTLAGVLTMVRRSGDIIGEGHLLRNLGEVHAATGRYEQARGAFERALAVREQIMDHGGAAAVRLDLARLMARAGARGRAGELLENAVATFRERGMRHELREAERLLGEIAASRPAAS
ncbi:AfsR/SARP family transcriptional regulator [Micromonospora yangpuensis]|uniref:DNA-binding transcriptional activator of the SARP family n=1 Tax=Micromonospora yangpuensis TaxID=683228 RepID=A0A1C6UNM8_9ACTN|nr:BTAD domain-containing putative transcriptional regulator [Micromonospora yangpuensis]GGM09128.1 SARP family transcriptional regulator [Micromonospora yangpuensis]SCL55631.1 DNA-binding transcriptional activator of the SARP family [Micromonospora yangpuensis]